MRLLTEQARDQFAEGVADADRQAADARDIQGRKGWLRWIHLGKSYKTRFAVYGEFILAKNISPHNGVPWMAMGPLGQTPNG